MRVLTLLAAFTVWIAIWGTGCTPAGSLTPREAFLELRAAYLRSDEKAMLKCLSRESIESIRRGIALMSAMSDSRRAATGKLYGIPADRMMNLTVEDYLTMHFAAERKNPGISAAVRYDIIAVEREENRAVVKVENGMELDFVREGPYWKFDMEAE